VGLQTKFKGNFCLIMLYSHKKFPTLKNIRQNSLFFQTLSNFYRPTWRSQRLGGSFFLADMLTATLIIPQNHEALMQRESKTPSNFYERRRFVKIVLTNHRSQHREA
jgi:hypothetical protein